MGKLKPIEIKFSCTQKYENMIDFDRGKFCESCNKCVIDFTNLDSNTFQEVVKEGHCGQFNIYQVSNPFNNWKDHIVRFAQKLERLKYSSKVLKKGALAISIGSLFLIGAYSCRTVGVPAYGWESYEETPQKPKKVKKVKDKKNQIAEEEK